MSYLKNVIRYYYTTFHKMFRRDNLLINEYILYYGESSCYTFVKIISIYNLYPRLSQMFYRVE